MRTALVKAIVLPAVCRANLEFQSHVPFQNSRTRVIDLRTRGRRGFCTLVHSFMSVQEPPLTHGVTSHSVGINALLNRVCDQRCIHVHISPRSPSILPS